VHHVYLQKFCSDAEKDAIRLLSCQKQERAHTYKNSCLQSLSVLHFIFSMHKNRKKRKTIDFFGCKNQRGLSFQIFGECGQYFKNNCISAAKCPLQAGKNLLFMTLS
jgi:hypothetical protein